MTTHYSILSVQIRPEIQEKISIGFLLMDESTILFNYSKNKLLAAKALLSETAYKLLKDALQNIVVKASNENKLKANPQQSILSSLVTNTFNKEYILYLSKYNNNIVNFTAPKEIELEVSQDVFSKLYQKFIDSTDAIEKNTDTNRIEQFKEERLTILNKHYNIDTELTHNQIDNLIVPVSITFIGQNEAPTIIQALDLEKPLYYLENDIAQILYLQSAFAAQKKETVSMAITNEPDKKQFPKQHDVWQQLNKRKDIKNIDVSNVEEVIEYAVQHNVLPYFPELVKDENSL